MLLVHAPSAQGRAQRADVIAAIAAKDAADAAARANPRPKAIAKPPQRAVDGQQEIAPEKNGAYSPGRCRNVRISSARSQDL